jgi:hypothetical protein
MSIEHCPRCSARVRVPMAAEPESWVRCPRCKMESQLSEMLAAEPPELELIDGPSESVPDYVPVMAGSAAGGDEFNEFEVTASDTLVVDEDSPTLPLGGIQLGDSFLDDEPSSGGAMIGRGNKSADDDLFGFDDDADTATLRSTSEDGKFVDVPDDGEAGFNLSPDTPGDDGAAAPISPVALGAGLKGIPTGMPRRKKKSGMLPMMIGVVGGGLFGIIIAYYGILMWAMGMDPFQLAKQFPEGLQMLLPASLQKKPVAKNFPAVTPENDPSENMPPDGEPMTPGSENGSSEPVVPAPANNDPLATPGSETPAAPAADPLDPLAMPEKPAKPMTDPADPFGNTDPVKPAADPLDPLGNNAPVKPAADPLDPLGNTAPVKPAADPLDPLGNDMPVKPEPAKPAAVDPLDPLAPVKPEMPAKPEADPLAPAPVDPLAAPAQPQSSEPLMLASASFGPADLEQSLGAATTSQGTLAQKPEDKPTQIATYRALSKLGEVAGQLKSLGETPEKSTEHVKALQAASKKLAEDPNVAGVAKLTAMWLTVAPEKRNNGIVLQGIPGTTEPAGKYQRTSLDVPGSDTKLTVVSEYPLLPNADGKVTVLGVIVDKPTEQIPGYPGPAERVIWVSVGEMEKPAAAPAGDAGVAPATPAPAPAKTPSDDPFGNN